MKQVKEALNTIILLTVVVLLGILLGSLYINVVQIAPYTKHQDFDDVSQVYISDTTNSVKEVSYGIALEPYTWYRIQFTVDAIEGPAPIELHIDFYGGPSYDGSGQESVQFFSNTTRSVKKTVYLYSGKSPEHALLRFFYKSPSTIVLENISVEKTTLPIRGIQYTLVIAFIVLLSFFLYHIRSNKVLFAGIALSLFVCAISVLTLPPGSGDSMWNVPVGLSLIKEGNIDLDEYSNLIESRNYYGITEFNGSYYNYFPIGGTIIPFPLIYIGHIIFEENISLIELLSSKLMFSITVFTFYLLCWIVSKDIKISIILSSIFAFATPNLYILSGALWTHGSAELMIILSLLAPLYGKRKQSDIIPAFSAIFLFLGYLARPTVALLAPIVFLYIILTRRRSAVLFIGLGIACLSIFIIWSLIAFGVPLPPYYAASRLSLETFTTALVGQLASPNRGLFIFVPFVLFSIVGMHKAIKDPNADLIFKLLPIHIVTYAIVLAMFPHWWGGHSYGPRLYTELMPIFAIYLYWVIITLQKEDRAYKPLIFIGIITYCVLVQSFAVVDPSYSVHAWNSLPVNVDLAPERIWDWSDMQIFRIIR